MGKERMRGQAMTAATVRIAVVRAVGLRNHSKVAYDGHTKREAPLEVGASRAADLVVGESGREFHAGGEGGGVRLWLWPGDMSSWSFMLSISYSHLPF